MDERQEFLEQWANAVVRAAEAIKSGNIEVAMQIQQEAEEAYWNFKQTEEDTIDDTPANDLAVESRNMRALVDEAIRRTINEFGEKKSRKYGEMAGKHLRDTGDDGPYHRMMQSMRRNPNNGPEVYKDFQDGFEDIKTEGKKTNKVKVTESQLFRLVNSAANMALKEIKTKNKTSRRR